MSSGANFARGYTSTVRYVWNTDYNTWDIFSEEGNWLGLSSSPRLSLDELKVLDDKLADGILDLTQCEDSSQDDDLNGMSSGDFLAVMDAASSQNGINGMEYIDEPNADTQSQKGSFLAAPQGAAAFEFHLMPAPNSRPGRSQEVECEVGQVKCAEAAPQGESGQSTSSPLALPDSSSPSSGNDRENNTLEQSSRDLIRLNGESHENKLTRRRSTGVEIASKDVESQQPEPKRMCTIDHANAINGSDACFGDHDPQSLTNLNWNTSAEADGNDSISTQFATHTRTSTSFHLSTAAMQKVLALVSDVPPESPLEELESPFEIPEDWLDDWIGPQNGTPQAFGDTLTIPTLEVRRNFRQVWVTREDMERYSWTVCRSLSAACHEQRARNVRVSIVSSMCKDYKKWRVNGGIEELREKYAAKSPEDLVLEAQMERLIMENDPVLDFAPGADDPLPSIEEADEEGGILAPHDQLADAYRAWGRQWHNISDIGHGMRK